jgi:hypothetical protein
MPDKMLKTLYDYQPPWLVWEVLHKVLPATEVEKLKNRFPTTLSTTATDPDDIQRQKFLDDCVWDMVLHDCETTRKEPAPHDPAKNRALFAGLIRCEIPHDHPYSLPTKFEFFEEKGDRILRNFIEAYLVGALTQCQI